MKILITGSNGYIGKALVNALSSHDLTLLHRGVCEMTDEKQVDAFFTENYDVVIHCAAAGGSRLKGDNPTVLHDNLKMFLNLYKHKDKFNKLIHFGSGAQYHAEDTYYGLSKRIISDLIGTEEKFYNIIIYGLFDKNEIDTRFIKSCINNCNKNKPILVHKNKEMDFFHMEDLLKLVNEYIAGKRKDKQVECVYMEKFNLYSIARLVILEIGKGEIILGEPGLDKPYTRIGSKPNWLAGSLEKRIKQTIHEILPIQ